VIVIPALTFRAGQAIYPRILIVPGGQCSDPSSKNMEASTRKALKDTLDALERLLNLFRVERVVHLIVGVIAMLMLFYVIGALLVKDISKLDTTLLVAIFGSSGLIAVSSARITYFFNKAFSLVEYVIRALVKSGGGE
jgi:hypothetical protein